ncbi:MAG: hypothetical protein JNM85_02315 [Chthonomonas sp.]|nr:hypothetical protein [Chthonomonas sp.]
MTTDIMTAAGRALAPVERRAIQAVASQVKHAFGDKLAELEKQYEAGAKNPVMWASDAAGLPPLRLSDLSAHQITELGKLRDSTEKLEAVLVKKMLESMDKALKQQSDAGPLGDMAKDMYRENFSEEIASKSLLGLSRELFQQLSNVYLGQEAVNRPKTPTTGEKQ